MGIYEFSLIWDKTKHVKTCSSMSLVHHCGGEGCDSPYFMMFMALFSRTVFIMHHHSSGFLGAEERIFLCERFGKMFCALGQKLLVLRLTPSAGMDLYWDFQAPEKGKTLSMPIYLGSFFTLRSLTTFMLAVLTVCFSLWADYNTGYMKIELLLVFLLFSVLHKICKN